MANAIALYPLYKNGQLVAPFWKDNGLDGSVDSYKTGFICEKIQNIRNVNSFYLSYVYTFSGDLIGGDSIDITINGQTQNIPFNTDMATTMADCDSYINSTFRLTQIGIFEAENVGARYFGFSTYAGGVNINVTVNSDNGETVTLTKTEDIRQYQAFDYYYGTGDAFDTWIVATTGDLNAAIGAGFTNLSFTDGGGVSHSVPYQQICYVELNNGSSEYSTTISWLGRDMSTLHSAYGCSGVPNYYVTAMNPAAP